MLLYTPITCGIVKSLSRGWCVPGMRTYPVLGQLFAPAKPYPMVKYLDSLRHFVVVDFRLEHHDIIAWQECI